MSAAKYSFTIEQGATTDFEIQYKDSASTAIDLTNYSGKMEIKSTLGYFLGFHSLSRFTFILIVIYILIVIFTFTLIRKCVS